MVRRRTPKEFVGLFMPRTLVDRIDQVDSILARLRGDAFNRSDTMRRALVLGLDQMEKDFENKGMAHA